MFSPTLIKATTKLVFACVLFCFKGPIHVSTILPNGNVKEYNCYRSKNAEKWLFCRCVEEHEFPGRTGYPKYCAGINFILSADLVPELYRASFSTGFFWVDDVFATGILPLKVNNIIKPSADKNAIGVVAILDGPCIFFLAVCGSPPGGKDG